MFFYMLMMLNLMNSTMMLFMKHPLAMGLTLLTQTFFITLISGIMMKTFWLSYILFLVFIGGLLVLFIYVTSLASNEKFNFSNKMVILNFILFSLWGLMLMMLDSFFFLNVSLSMDSLNLIYEKTFFFENTFSMNKMFNFPISLITILLMIYLFLTLIVVVKITNIFEGPLRSKM